MKYNYSKLLGRIKEFGFTQEQFAKEVGIGKTALSLKLNSKSYFTAKEISKICDVLQIPYKQIGEYFFAI